MQALPSQLYNAGQIRELERIAIEECGITAFELMTRAGQAVFSRVLKRWPNNKQIAVFCGSGNNAGDGFIVARLALLAGHEVKVYCLTDPAFLKGAALQAYLSFAEIGGQFEFFHENQSCSADIVIDAILGTGLTREVIELFAKAIQLVNLTEAYKIAVDIPSGLHADTGNVMGCAVKVDETITFIALKQGLFTGYAAEYCGEISFASLNVPENIYTRVHSDVLRLARRSLPKRRRCVHKGSNGHVIVIGGNLGYSGAARLAGEAAARVGAGLVSLATRKEHAAYLNHGRPELMCHGIESALQLTDLIASASVIVIGPGLGKDEWAESLFHEAVKSRKPMVVDADGLNWLARFPQNKSNWVLTPHPGEAARLLMLAVSTQCIQSDRYKSVRSLQKQYGGIIVLKGAGSLIATDGKMAVSNTGNPGMASGGMGDVLSGVIGGLLAQGLSLEEASQQGVYIHGAAADIAANQDGERGLLASDLMPYLRKLVN